MSRSNRVRIDTILTSLGVYEGECEGRVAHGYGMLHHKDGSIRMGYFQGLAVHGTAVRWSVHHHRHLNKHNHTPNSYDPAESITCTVGEFDADTRVRHGVSLTVQGSSLRLTDAGDELATASESTQAAAESEAAVTLSHTHVWALSQLIRVTMEIVSRRAPPRDVRPRRRVGARRADVLAVEPADGYNESKACLDVPVSSWHTMAGGRVRPDARATRGYAMDCGDVDTCEHVAEHSNDDENENDNAAEEQRTVSLARMGRVGDGEQPRAPDGWSGGDVCGSLAHTARASAEAALSSVPDGRLWPASAAPCDGISARPTSPHTPSMVLAEGCLYSVRRKDELSLPPAHATAHMPAHTSSAAIAAAVAAVSSSSSRRHWSHYLTDACPGGNERFTSRRFVKFLLIFLFPFLSLPGTPMNWLRVTSLGMERLFVVSGAALRTDFESPVVSLYATALAMLGYGAACIVIRRGELHLGTSEEGLISVAELVLPGVLWFALALMSACYEGYLRVPHLLESHNRQGMSPLTAYAANVVDAQARVCIYTWHENGYGKVRNHHYRYRWMAFASVVALCTAAAAPLARLGARQAMFGSDGFTVAAGLLLCAVTFLLGSVFSYHVLKCTDMQREMVAKMRVLTNLAFLNQSGVVHRGYYLGPHFDLDMSLDTLHDLEGFPGWYTIRSVVLYLSTSSKHGARSAAMSVFVLLMFLAHVAAVGEMGYVLLVGEGAKDMHHVHCIYVYGLFFFVLWGLLLTRYLYVCWQTRTENELHMYVMDATSLYHSCQLRDANAAATITLCRNMASSQDVCPHFLGQRLNALWAVALVLTNAGATAVMAVHMYWGLKTR